MGTVRAAFLLQLGTVQGLYNDVSSGAIDSQTLQVSQKTTHIALLPSSSGKDEGPANWHWMESYHSDSCAFYLVAVYIKCKHVQYVSLLVVGSGT